MEVDKKLVVPEGSIINLDWKVPVDMDEVNTLDRLINSLLRWDCEYGYDFPIMGDEAINATLRTWYFSKVVDKWGIIYLLIDGQSINKVTYNHHFEICFGNSLEGKWFHVSLDGKSLVRHEWEEESMLLDSYPPEEEINRYFPEIKAQELGLIAQDPVWSWTNNLGFGSGNEIEEE